MNRRGFLQLTGATGAAALTASCNRINSVACVRNHVGKQPASLAHAVSIRTSCSTGWQTALAVAFVVGLFYVTYNCHVWQSRCLLQLCREMHRGFVTKAGFSRMLGTTHKADRGAIVGRAVGLFVLLIGVLFAAALCNASAHSDNPATIFEPHSTPAESIYHLSPFVFAITGMIFLAVFNSGTPSGERNYAMSLNEGGLLPGRRAPLVPRSHAGQDSTGPPPAGSLCL
jgi:hypothetical protein